MQIYNNVVLLLSIYIELDECARIENYKIIKKNVF
jgi:hypothetical protein